MVIMKWTSAQSSLINMQNLVVLSHTVCVDGPKNFGEDAGAAPFCGRG